VTAKNEATGVTSTQTTNEILWRCCSWNPAWYRDHLAAPSGLHVNGARDRAYNATIDGIEANESSVPKSIE